MKKTLICIVAVAFAALMIANACAVERAPGFTPGFWKHNIAVALGHKHGKYSAFEGGPLDGVKLTHAMLDSYAVIVGVTLQEAYDALTARGFLDAYQVRADAANAFNAAAGYGPFED